MIIRFLFTKVGLHFDFATSASLTDTLMRRNCRALHFSCHGDLGQLTFIFLIIMLSIHIIQADFTLRTVSEVCTS